MKSRSTLIKLMAAGLITLLLCSYKPVVAYSQTDTKIQKYVDSMEQSKEGMNLWDTIKSGGLTMLFLFLLSVVTGALIVYLFMHLKVSKLVPHDFTEKLIEQLEKGQEKAVQDSCNSVVNPITNIVLAGLNKKKRGKLFAKEAMETQVKKEISDLWQSISYLSDISTVAPLIGLFGTVMGMIQAFNVIAYQSAVVKPILLAGGISKAMVATAGGLLIAIPAMLFYSYFRGKVQVITHEIETYGTDIIKIFEKVGA
ncbi:MAG: MotA/TolQ/ExbB proton channel family protein [Candidatus Omnitrophica bacterium]|nr:MotA/TolQ/ExbB proton channel family protein [Candidatus Omnitrophota bacterium]